MKTVEIIYRYGTSAGPLRPRPADPAAARLRLDEGSQALVSLLEGLAEEDGVSRRIVEVDPHDLGLQEAERGAPTQRPYAAVLGCSDARVPIELIFNEGPNDLFVVRVAGNSLGSDVLGSLRYAVEHLRDSLRLVVVLGHSGCGALSTAVDAFLHPAAYLPVATNYALRSILDRLLIVVQAAARMLATAHGAEVTQRPGYRVALIEAAIAANAAFTAYTVQQELHGLDRSDLRAVYGVYLLQGHEIWAPCPGTGLTSGLADPPANLAAFIAFGDAVGRSDRIAALLG